MRGEAERELEGQDRGASQGGPKREKGPRQLAGAGHECSGFLSASYRPGAGPLRLKCQRSRREVEK